MNQKHVKKVKTGMSDNLRENLYLYQKYRVCCKKSISRSVPFKKRKSTDPDKNPSNFIKNQKGFHKKPQINFK